MDWPTLANELDCWADAGQPATLWWRDDDAVAPSRALDRLLAMGERVPIALAVVPEPAVAELADRLSGEPQVTVMQHGWRHVDHAAQAEPRQRSSEYPGGRAEAEVSSEFVLGRRRLVELFGERALPVFVPPWHQLDDRFLPLLRRAGISGISRRAPRQSRTVAGLVQTNIHATLMQWIGSAQIPVFAGEAAVLTRIEGHLRGRRLGAFDSEEPTGILTHHLVEDTASYSFAARLLELTLARHVRWLGAKEIFLGAPAVSRQ